MPYALTTRNLTFTYRRGLPVVRELNLNVPAGAVYGFLGQNGAGKTTTLKLLLGLLRPHAGEVQLLGQPLRPGRPELFRQVGALIEKPPLYPHLSGRENLRVTCAYRGLPDQRIDEVLAAVDMHGHADKLVRHYSTGMRQRLGIGLAVLPNPALLVLDEPTNGLDAQGIRDVRDLIARLGSTGAGTTILLSSHLLSEIERICTHVGVLHDGRLLFEGTLGELRQRHPPLASVWLETDDDVRAAALLGAHWQDGRLSAPIVSREEIPPLIERLRAAGIGVYRVQPREPELEELYLTLLNEE